MYTKFYFTRMNRKKKFCNLDSKRLKSLSQICFAMKTFLIEVFSTKIKFMRFIGFGSKLAEVITPPVRTVIDLF